MKTQTRISALAPARPRQRRGVILLVVMGFLALLTMVAVTYVIASREFKMTARAATATERYDDGFEELLERAFRQIIRGSQNPYSAASIHSLLEDLYGNDAIPGTVAAASWNNTSGWLNVDVNVDTSNPDNHPRPIHQFYTGRVLTFTDGDLANVSFRIISYHENAGQYRFRLLPVTQSNTLSAMANPKSGDHFLVNGRPFNGAGFGFNPANSDITEQALRPNPAFAGDITAGGADEDYDIPDYNNFHLAARVWSTSNNRWEVRSPSFFNPALINWHRAQGHTTPDEKRTFMLRPLTDDDYHPDFTGSNPYNNDLNALNIDRDGNGVPDLIWDVDNDGDGLPDSVWVDLGMPVQMSADGRYYKPLFAVLILDMDSRINVNTHGSDRHVAHVVPFYLDPSETYDGFGTVTPGSGVSSQPFPNEVANTWNNLIPGLGAGPAEVNPLGILGADEFKQLLFGIKPNGLVGRYGELRNAPADLTSNAYLRAGWTDGKRDVTPAIRNDRNYNPDAYAFVDVDNSLPRHPWVDLDGDMGVIVPYTGVPIKAPRLQHGNLAVPPIVGMRNINVDVDDVEHPYHLNPYRDTFQEMASRAEWVDAPFTMREAEVFLRHSDVDSSTLPRRLMELIPTAFNSAKRRGQLTAESYSIPVPTYQPTPLMRQRMQAEGVPATNLSFPELVFWKIKTEYFRHNDTDMDNAEAWGLVKDLFDKKLFPIELILGQKWNPTQGSLDRDEYARQLYMLAMLVQDLPDTHDNSAYGEPVAAQRIAQWAINVVDFADTDRIMTGFEFDLYPFVDNASAGTTWNVDNNLTTSESQDYRGVAWGAEKPELLITETFATHDTRTEDLAGEDVNPMDRAKVTAAVNPDDDFDQRRRPQGSVFLELFNPDLTRRIDLGQLTDPDPGDPSGRRSPVWQILLVRTPPPLNANPQLAHLDPTWPGVGDAERVVWFITQQRINNYVDPTHVTMMGNKLRYSRLRKFDVADPEHDYENQLLQDDTTGEHYEQLARNTFEVPAGGFTVIGPRVRTRFGRSGANASETMPHTIRLLPQSGGSSWTPDAVVAYVGGSPLETNIVRDAHYVDYPLQSAHNPGNAQIKRVRGIVINAPQPLNVTEPVEGYDPAEFTTQDPDDNTILYKDAYGNDTNPYPDEPFDIEGGFPRMVGTHELVFGVYLQRIADTTKPFHPVTNPYLTVDYAPMDLHVFNGETDWEYLMTNDPDQTNRNLSLKFQTRERLDNTGHFNIWRQSFAPLSLISTEDPLNPQTDRRPHHFRHSLGFIAGFRNKPPTMTNPDPDHWYAENGIWFEGQNYSAFDLQYTDPVDGPVTVNVNLLGWPKAPHDGMGNRNYNATTPWFFPWFGWFNRPYVNPMELLLVPACSPSRLLYEYHMLSDNNAYSGHNPFVNDQPYTGGTPPKGDEPPYRHLMNFFQTQMSNPLMPRGLHRMFDFIETPSRFHGSKLRDAEGNMHPLYRDAGRVNINTVFDDGDTWAALFNLPGRNTQTDEHWRLTWESRQGFGTGTVGRLELNDAYPTFFDQPFRAFSHERQKPYSDPSSANEVHATLFRRHPQPQGSEARPLLASRTRKESTASIFDANSPYYDGDRHPYFRYQPLSRIANNYSTTSNVYAVWVTVGYFEATPVPRSEIHPDGFQYGQELGSDTGDVVRHRGFFIYDRSIPVGFARGEDLNSDQGVLVRRVIE